MWCDWFGDPGCLGRLVTDVLNSIRRDRTAWNIAWKEIRGGSVSSPVSAEQLQQFGGEHDKTILTTLALAHGNHLSTAAGPGEAGTRGRELV
jgi:hypothetical protein